MDECHWYTPPEMQINNQVDITLSATAMNEMTTAPAQVCFGADFNGSDNWAYTIPTDILSNLREMTISFYVRFDSLGTSGYQSVMFMGDTSETVNPTFQLDYYVNQKALRLFVYTDDTNYYWSDFIWTPNPGEWYNITYTFYKNRPEQIHVYLDGVEKIAPTMSNGTFERTRDKSSRIVMGKYRPSQPRFLNGGLDEIQIFDYALNHDQIDNLVQETHECTNNCGNLEIYIYYKLDECAYYKEAGEVKDYANQLNLHASIGAKSDPYSEIGKVCRGMNFDGDFDFIQSPVTPSILGGSELTLSLWCQISDTSNYVPLINQMEGDGTNEVFSMHFTNGVIFFRAMREDGHLTISTSDFTQTLDKWYHVAVTLDTSDVDTLSFFINGQRILSSNVTKTSVGTGPFVGSSISAPIFIGRGIDSEGAGDTTYIAGILDDIKMFSNALTDNQILDIYYEIPDDCPSCGESAFPAMAGFWKFDECLWSGEVYEIKDQT
ncbi:MAG: LamG domain-containing protein, partial [Candidatus Marinimicrobia bacterium]|nr:LamG domain-containing protein [Candidatus Neomarinimicrobiota bacterium]